MDRDHVSMANHLKKKQREIIIRKINSFVNAIGSFIFLSLLFIPLHFASGETLLLKSGETLEGKVVNQNRETINFQQENGEIRILKKVAVKKISYSNSNTPGLGENPESHRENETVKRVKKKEWEEMLAREEIVWAWMHRDDQHLTTESDETNEADDGEESIHLLPGPQGIPLRGILWRNSLLPGWGDFYGGSPESGRVKATFFALSVASVIYFDRSYLSVKKAYTTDSANYMNLLLSGARDGAIPARQLAFSYFYSMDASSYRSYQSAGNNLNNSLLLIGGIYLGNLIHSFFLKGKSPSISREDSFGSLHYSIMANPSFVAIGDGMELEGRISGVLQFRF